MTKTISSDELLAVWASFGMDFQALVLLSRTMPMPGVFLSSSDGVLRFAQTHPLHWQRTEPADLLAAIEALADERAVQPS